MSFFSYNKDYQSDSLRSHMVDSRIVGRLVSYLYPYRSWVLAILMILIFAKGLESFVPILLGRTIQFVIDAVSYGYSLEIAMVKTLRACMVTGAVLLLNYVLDVINVLLKNSLGQRVINTLRSDVFRSLQRQPIAYYASNPVGRLMSRIIQDVESIGKAFSESIVQIVGNIVLLIAMVIGGLIIQWQVTLIVLLVAPLIAWLTYRFRCTQRRCYQFLHAVKAAMSSFIQERLMGASTIRHFALEKEGKKQFDALNQDLCHAHLEGTHYFSFFTAGLDLGQSVILIITFVTLVLVTPADASFQGGIYFTFSIYVLMFFRPLRDVAERYNLLQEALAGAERVFDLIDRPGEELDKGETLKSVESVEFRNVWFAYQDEHWVLKGLNFTLKRGEVLALVGMSGSGKSTVTRLLNRFYAVQKGKILVNGKSIESYSLSSIRRHFGTVQQEATVFAGTVAENLSLYDLSIKDERLQQAIDDVNLREVVTRSTRGIHETVAALKLSAGEQQLLTLGRAIASGADVIVLDEATASVDSATEHKVQQTLARILEGHTALVIAHRLSTIQRAQRILVMHHGVIREEGSHEELLAAGGIYEKLYRYQYA